MSILLNKIDATITGMIDILVPYGHIGKMMLLFLVSGLMTPIVYGVNRFVDSNVEYVVVWVALLMSDSLSGVIKHWIKRTLSFEEFFIKATIKTFVSFCGLTVFTAFAVTFDKGGDAEEYLLLFGQIAVSVYIGESALVNLYTITDKKFPPVAFMERLKSFKEDGTMDSFTKIHKKDGSR